MYRFPKSRFATADLASPKIVRDMVQPASEELSGYLNEHNIEQGTFPLARRSESLLYDFHYADVAVDMDATIANGAMPVATDPNAYAISDSGEWTVIPDVTLTWSGANDKIWVLAWFQYSIVPEGAVREFSLSTASYTKPRVQFALRINGAVIDDTLTGLEDMAEASIQHFYPVTPLTKTVADFVSIDPSTTKGCSSLCWHCRLMRLQTVMDIPQGEVTVELVGRRVPPNDSIDITGEMERVYVFNRKVLAVQMKRGGVGSLSPGVSVQVEYPTEETTWGTSSLVSDILDPLKDAINGLLPGNLMMYSLRREHLPAGGSLKEKEQVELTAGTSTVRSWPGWGSNGTVDAANWDEINDGAGNYLRITGPFDYTADPGFVLLLGNIAFTKADGWAVVASRYGAFAIAGMYSSGTPFKQDSAEGFTNCPNVTPATTMFDCDTDVPLMEFFDYRTAPPAGGVVDYYRALVAFWGAALPGQVDWGRSNLILLHFRP